MDRLHIALALAAFVASVPAFGLEAAHRRAASRQLEIPRMQVARLTPPRPQADSLPPSSTRLPESRNPGVHNGIRRWFSHVNWYQATPADRELTLFPATVALPASTTIPARR